MTAWLWPDHEIGKRESRRLRDEHNALATAAQGVLDRWERGDLAAAVRLLAEALGDTTSVRSAAHDQNLRDIMTTAIEGGINYWAKTRDILRDPKTLEVLAFDCRDAEDHNAEWRTVTFDSLDAAIAKIIDGNMSEAKQLLGYKHEDWSGADASAADVAVQVAAFDGVLFG